MSWSVLYHCPNCKNADICPDKQKFNEAQIALNNDPAHAEKGGFGTMVVMCYDVAPQSARIKQ